MGKPELQCCLTMCGEHTVNQRWPHAAI